MQHKVMSSDDYRNRFNQNWALQQWMNIVSNWNPNANNSLKFLWIQSLPPPAARFEIPDLTNQLFQLRPRLSHILFWTIQHDHSSFKPPNIVWDSFITINWNTVKIDMNQKNIYHTEVFYTPQQIFFLDFQVQLFIIVHHLQPVTPTWLWIDATHYQF